MIYEEFEVKGKKAFREIMKERRRNMGQLYTLLLRLRQACCHPYLVLNSEEHKHGLNANANNLMKKVPSDVIRRLNNSDSIPNGV